MVPYNMLEKHVVLFQYQLTMIRTVYISVQIMKISIFFDDPMRKWNKFATGV